MLGDSGVDPMNLAIIFKFGYFSLSFLLDCDKSAVLPVPDFPQITKGFSLGEFTYSSISSRMSFLPTKFSDFSLIFPVNIFHSEFVYFLGTSG